jgi:hypothetical protein
MLGVAAYYGFRYRRYPAALLFAVVLLQTAVGGGLIGFAISRKRWLGTSLAYLLLVVVVALLLETTVYGLVMRIRQVAIDRAAKDAANKAAATADGAVTEAPDDSVKQAQDKAATSAVAGGEVAEDEDESAWTVLGHPVKRPPAWFRMLFAITFLWLALLLFWTPYHNKAFHTGVVKYFAFELKLKAIQDNIDHIGSTAFGAGALIAGIIYCARKQRWPTVLGLTAALALWIWWCIVGWGWA